MLSLGVLSLGPPPTLPCLLPEGSFASLHTLMPPSLQRSDPHLLAQFYYADEELNQVAAELDSLDGRKDPQRCTLLVSQFRSCQVSGCSGAFTGEAELSFPASTLQGRLSVGPNEVLGVVSWGPLGPPETEPGGRTALSRTVWGKSQVRCS